VSQYRGDINVCLYFAFRENNAEETSDGNSSSSHIAVETVVMATEQNHLNGAGRRVSLTRGT